MSPYMAKRSAALALATAGVIFLTAAAQAQAVRYIATGGLNSNDCSREAPCRTLQRGINRTPDGGELVILDSGNFGNSATINKSITVSANGISATVGAIVIDAAGAAVTLRGLLLNGRDVAADTPGILVNNAAAVHIFRCEIQRFSGGNGDGIHIIGGVTNVFVSDTIARDNGGRGIHLVNFPLLTVENSRFESNAAGGIRAIHGKTTLSRVVVSGSPRGIEVAANGVMSAAWTVASNNSEHGFFATNGAQLTLESSLAQYNGGAGLLVSNSALGTISNSTFTNNGIGIQNSGGGLFSRGNNASVSNSNNNNVLGAVTPLSGV